MGAGAGDGSAHSGPGHGGADTVQTPPYLDLQVMMMPPSDVLHKGQPCQAHSPASPAGEKYRGTCRRADAKRPMSCLQSPELAVQTIGLASDPSAARQCNT